MLTLFFWIGASIAVGMAAHNYRNPAIVVTVPSLPASLS